MVNNPPAMQEIWVRTLGWEDPLGRAWHPTSVFLPGESPWTEEPGGLQSMGSQRVRHDWVTYTLAFSTLSIGPHTIIWDRCFRCEDSETQRLNNLPRPHSQRVRIRIQTKAAWLHTWARKLSCCCFSEGVNSLVKETQHPPWKVW